MQRFCSAADRARAAILQRIGSVLATLASHPAAMGNRNDAGRPGAGRRSMDWQAAFLSGDPAMQWAAACSVAQAVAGHDRWVDSTAVHEARIGAYETAVDAVQSDPDSVVPAAVAGARRALYWERRARSQLVPPTSLHARRWRSQPSDAEAVKLVPLSAAAEADREYPTGQPSMTAPGSALAEIAAHLVDRGWRWPVPAAHAVGDAVQAVLSVGRDRAAASLASIHSDLPRVVTEGLVLLVAGSRMRTSRPWPGVVWLAEHRGLDAAFDDPGARNVIDGLVTGRSVRPSVATGAAVVAISRRRRSARHMSRTRLGGAVAANHPSREGLTRDEVAS